MNQNKSVKNTIHHVLIIGANSGIGEALAARYINDGVNVVGTYRSNICKNIQVNGIELYQLDINDNESIKEFSSKLQYDHYSWDLVIFSVGTLEPIGNFQSVEFEEWQNSFSTNFFGQLHLLRRLRNLASTSATVVFFTGGAPGGVLPNYSAYSVAKIALTKMVEYLDAEDSNVKYAIVGPGWVNTKIHLQTIKAGNMAGENLGKTQSFLENDSDETTMQDIFECINWIAGSSKLNVGGRNFSVVWDDWGDQDEAPKLEARLSADINLFKLRRYEG